MTPVGAGSCTVTVTDKKGNQILGLTKDDFILKEDGEQKQIDSVDYFTNRRLLTSPEDKAASESLGQRLQAAMGADAWREAHACGDTLGDAAPERRRARIHGVIMTKHA